MCFSLKGKCIKYWPDEKIPKQYGNLDIILVGEDLFADYIVRTLKIVHVSLQKRFRKICFTSYISFSSIHFLVIQSNNDS